MDSEPNESPLERAFRRKQFPAIVKLIEESRNPNREQIFKEANDLAQVYQSDRLLNLACIYGSIGIVKFFLDSSFCTVEAVNEPNEDGDTPLHFSARNNWSEIVEMLLTCRKVDANATNVGGETTLIAACKNDSIQCAQILASFQTCDLNKQDNTGNTALHVAVQHNHCELIRSLLSNNSCDPNISNQEDDTPLHIASREGMVRIVEMLLACRGIDADVRNTAGETALIVACSNDCIECAQLLGSYQGCDLNKQDNTGSTALHVAVECSNWKLVSILLSNSSCDPNISNLHGDTPLHIASREGMVKIVEMLLACHGIDINAKNASGETALVTACDKRYYKRGSSEHYFVDIDTCSRMIENQELTTQAAAMHLALEINRSKCVAKLLASNCDPNIANVEGDTPLHIACQQTSLDILNILLSSERLTFYAKNAKGEMPLHVASLEAMKCLIKSGRYSLNEKDSEGNTVLHIAVQTKYRRCVALLLTTTSCDPNTANSEGDTPLHIACQKASVDIIRVLLSSERLNLYAKNARGKMPLHVARLEAMKCLIKSARYSFMINEQDSEGNTVLHIAVQTKKRKCVALLLTSTSCDPNIVNSEGDTPLHIACQQGSVEIIDLLISTEKFHLSQVISKGNTVLHLAVQSENRICVEKLLANTSCDPNIANSEGDTPLHIACQQGSVEIIDLLLSSEKFHLSQVNSKGNTVLHLAVQSKDRICVEKLLASTSCDPNIANSEGDTPLHIACQQGSVEIIDLLLSSEKFNLSQVNSKGNTVLHLAVQSKDRICVEKLLASTCCDPNIANSESDTPLHIACQQGSVEIIDLLISTEKFHLSQVNSKGNTVLHLAVQSENRICVEKLLANTSCDPNIANSEGDTPLHIACQQGSVEIIDLLISTEKFHLSQVNSKGNTVLHLAVQSENRICVEKLLANTSCDPNIANSEGDTPLHIACQQGSVEIIDLLISTEKFHLSQVNSKGNTVLHLAVQSKNRICVEKLLASTSCAPNIANSEGDTPLHIATKAGEVQIIELFTKASKCNPNVKNHRGEVPLHIAIESELNAHTEIVKLLLCIKDCDPNICNSQGETPLHVACKMRNLECVKLLSNKKQCNVDKQNKTGDTALHVAIQQEQVSIVKYLTQDAHCNPTLSNVDGNTPLHLACSRGAWNAHISILHIVKFLLSTGKVDPECVNNNGSTPVQMAGGNVRIVKELNYFVVTKSKHPIQSYIKLFFTGNAEVGKSTLVKAICTEASKLRKLAPSSQYKQVTGVKLLTAGIVPLAFRSKHFGNAILYDFAGQHEYYSSHAAVLENLVLSSPPVFLLVFNLSEPIEQIREELAYWWSFIGSHCKKTSVTPHVILIGSHKDVVKSRGDNVKERIEQIIKNMKEIPATFYIAGHVTLDCRSLVSNGLSNLLTLLKDTCEKLRKNVTVDLRCHVLYAFLTDKFPHRIACTVSEVQEAIRMADTLLPQNPTDLEKLLCTLSDKDQILFLKRPSQCFGERWIVLQRQKLLSEVNGSIFAPENFREHIKDFAQSTGVVPLSNIKQNFPNYPSEVLMGSLCHLVYCFKIEDYQTIDISTSESKQEQETHEGEEFYFFPALVQVDNPTNVWKPNSKKPNQCGWFYECVHRYQFLTSRFLHVLILRLAFSFALAVDHIPSEECPVIRRKCSIWKHGIAWWNRDGIETIVEVGLQWHWVVVMMRCARDQQVECVQLRTAVIKSILDTRAEFCPTILMSESLISASCIHYPFQKDNTAFYSLKEVATAIITGKSYVTHDLHDVDPIQLTELLPFEPYSGLTEEILEKLFSDKHSEKEITDHDLIQIAEKAYQNLELFKAVIKPNPLTWQRCCEQAGSNEVLLCVYLLQVFRDRGSKTFKELQTQLSKFSIFCGRNPLDVAEVKCSAVQNTAHNSNSAHTVSPSSPPSVSSADSPQAATDIQPSAAATTTELSPLQQSTEDVDSPPLAPLPSSSPSLPSTDNTRIPADLDMQVPPNSAAATAKISLLQQWTEYGEVDNTPLAVNPTLSTEPALVMVSCGKETQQYQILFSNFPKLVEALSSMVSAEGLADKLYFSAGLITKDLWEEACVGGVTNSKKLRPLINSILSQVELNATNYDKFVAVLKEFDELQDIVQLLEIV